MNDIDIQLLVNYDFIYDSQGNKIGIKNVTIHVEKTTIRGLWLGYFTSLKRLLDFFDDYNYPYEIVETTPNEQNVLREYELKLNGI